MRIQFFVDSLNSGSLSVNVEVDMSVKWEAESLGVKLKVGVLVAADPMRGRRRFPSTLLFRVP